MSNPKNSHSSDAGFTLIEVLIALTILTIGILGIAGLAGTAVRSSGYSQALTQATNIAQDRIEALQSIDYQNLEASDNAGPAGLRRNCAGPLGAANRPFFNCNPINPIIWDGRTYTWTYTVTVIDLNNNNIANNSDGLKRIDVTVSWTDAFNNAKTLTLTTLRTRG